jgi:uncharacterized DUF497 family protein
MREEAMFDWDVGNGPKIEQRFSRDEVESVFADPGRIDSRAYDKDGERRSALVGRTGQGRIIFVAYTLRGDRIRIISARPARIYEREQYREANP